MKYKKYIWFLIIACTLWLWVTRYGGNIDFIDGKKPEDFEKFVSDGCSMFPNWDYLDCCIEHDKAYFLWWNWKQRLKADNDFYSCIYKKWEIHHNILAPGMYIWVRLGGAPLYPTPYRWGFGRDRY